MIVPLDTLLRDHLLDQVATLGANVQRVRFQPPDEDFLTYVRGINELVLNAYLVDLREHRALRTNERETVLRGEDVFTTRAPDRLECHYLLSAWSPAQPSPGLEPTLDEHALLFQASRALFRHAPLRPSTVYPPGAPELAAWGRFVDDDLPMRVLPPDGFPGLGDFWSAMGTSSRWRPGIYLTATVPVQLLEDFSGPMVTTQVVDHRFPGQLGPGEVLIQIGGHVVNDGAAGGAAPLVGALVNLEDPASGRVLDSKRTDDQGRFTFNHLPPGAYRLRTRSVGLPVRVRDITVPEPAGEYDVRYP